MYIYTVLLLYCMYVELLHNFMYMNIVCILVPCDYLVLQYLTGVMMS